MKSVGIKMLKNNLSRYLELVRRGERVLVTDRDEVIAELRQPSFSFADRAVPWGMFLEQAAQSGAVRLAKRKRSKLRQPAPNPRLSAVDLLDTIRSDRF